MSDYSICKHNNKWALYDKKSCVYYYGKKADLEKRKKELDDDNESFKQAALAAGIPLSVIEGKTKLRDHFSQEYIDFNKETEDETE